MQDESLAAISGVEVDKQDLDANIAEFTGRNAAYYQGVFHKIHAATSPIPFTFNWMAGLLGPIWAAGRGVWGFFWTFIILETIAWVQIGRGAWGNLGAEDLAKAERQYERASGFMEKADAARAAGEDPSRFETLAGNMTRAAEQSQAAADEANAAAVGILFSGLAIMLALKLVQAVYANIAYEAQYSRWRIDRNLPLGWNGKGLVLGILLFAAIVPLTVYKFTVASVPEMLQAFPADKELYASAADWLEGIFDAAAAGGAGMFDGITAAIRWILEALTIALIGTPWPVVMAVICVVAWRAAGHRVAIFTAASLAYVAFLGYWEISMETVALVGAAAFLCVLFGIPLGIWFGKSPRAYRVAEPVLDFMQTMPAFVYLIPIIAFFGTGNPPGVLATIVFGMPPVVRLTALGVRGVPDTIKEAASAFGASRWQLLRDVEVPLALPSIMTGVNQTILMCLSMVVIISLIGGGGLGKVILEALQYAAKGPGLLGGFAILFCAMVIDRIVQGGFRRKDQK